MTYYIGEAVRLMEKMFAHVLEVAFVMSFVLIFIMAVRFAMRKHAKTLSYGLWGAAGAGLLYAALPFLRRFAGEGIWNAGPFVQRSGLLSKLTGFADIRLGVHADSVQAAGHAVSDAGLPTAAAVSDALRDIVGSAKAAAAGSGAGIKTAAGAGSDPIWTAGAASGGEIVQSAGGGIDALFSGGISLWTLLSVLWAAGVIIFAVYSVWSAVRLRRRVRFAVRLQSAGQGANQEAENAFGGRKIPAESRRRSRFAERTDQEAENAFGERKISTESRLAENANQEAENAGQGVENASGGLSDKYRIYECEQIDSPFVAGIFRPKIYLPSGLTGYDRGLILAHELCHIKRKDHLVLLAVQAVTAVFWFHPLFWAAYQMLRRDMEMSCDERAVTNFDRSQVADYSAVLLSFGLRKTDAMAVSFGARPSVLKQRISNVLSERKRRPVLSVMSAAVCLCAAVIMITAGCGLIDTGSDFAKWFYPWIAGDMEESEAEELFEDIGTVIGESRTADGVTVTLKGVVKDRNILLLAFVVDGAEPKNDGKKHAVYDMKRGKSRIIPDGLIEELRKYSPEITDEEIDEYLEYYNDFDEELSPIDGSIKCSEYGEDSFLIIFSFENYQSNFASGTIHLEDLDSYLFSLKGPYDFTYKADREPESVVYTGDVPFTTPSGIQCRVKKVALSPLSGAAVQMTLDRELEEHKIGPDGEERLPDWQRELLIEAVRTDAGYDVGCKSRGWDYEGRELTILGGDFYWILNTETAEAIQIGDNWIDFEQMTRSYENDKAAD